jgi:hypothetical protein
LSASLTAGTHWLAALAAYEGEMLQYGFAAVAKSLKTMQQATGDNRLGLTMRKTALRVVNAVPALKERVLAGFAEANRGVLQPRPGRLGPPECSSFLSHAGRF